MKMKKTVLAITVVVLLTGLLLTGCRMEGSGNIETREFDFSDFTKVEIGSAFDFEISRSDSYSISITMDDNMFEHIHVTKEGETLKIGITSKIALITIADFRTTARKAVIIMPQLTGLDISGASEGIVSGFESTEELEMNASGASKLSFRGDLVAGDVDIDVSGASRIDGINVNADNVDIGLSGGSRVYLVGSADDLAVNGSGGSHLILESFSVDNADIHLSGGGSATINVNGTLDVNLSGGSEVIIVFGNPTIGDIDLSGGSTLKEK